MNRLFVLKDVAYAAKKGGGTIAGANELNVLASGALALLNDKGELIAVDGVSGEVLAASVADSKTFTIAVGRASGVQVISQVPRQEIFELNLAPYVAPSAMVVTLGGGSTPLVIGENQEAVVKVYDKSFTSRYNIQDINVSVTRRTGETTSAAIDRIVAKLNAETSFVTAAKVGTTEADFGITVTPKDARTTISVALSGTFENGKIATTTAQVYGSGVGADVLQLEKDFSVEEGNGNYIDYGGDHYRRGMEANADGAYDMINFMFEGRHSSPTRSHNVMRNRVVIAAVDGAVNQEAASIVNILSALIGKAFDPAFGEEPAEDAGTDNDGVAGN